MLPLPTLKQRILSGIPVLTDDALASSVGIRMGFTSRVGGVSQGSFGSLNLGSHVNDSLEDVLRNRDLLLEALGAKEAPLIVPNQVHGDQIVTALSSDAHAVGQAVAQAAKGADSVVVAARGVAALLCFADCTPVILVAPGGQFCVAHAGWRGAVAGIVGKSLNQLCAVAGCNPSEVNMYVGPHIHQECFEVSEEIAQRFAEAFGAACVPQSRHVSLWQAVRADALACGASPERVIDAGVCTQCNPDQYYSYRASGGVCGRHGAIAVRL